MAKFNIPPKENFTKQVIVSILVLALVSILVAVFAKMVIGLVIFLLGMVAGIGTQVVGDTVDKE